MDEPSHDTRGAGRGPPPYTRAVAASEITQSLAYITWVLLVGLALGSVALAWLLRQTTDATTGFVGFTLLCGALLAGLGLLTDLSLPDPAALHIVASPAFDTPRRMALALLAGFALLASTRVSGSRRATIVGAAAIVSGLAAEAFAAVGWADGTNLGLPLLVQVATLSAIVGGSLAAVILAHWYLVTPRISERPLVLASRLLVVALGIQLLLFVVWQAVGIPKGPPFSGLTGPEALFAWLRLAIGILFPMVLTVMAYRTALTRSMESATGLLYIEFAAVLASTIVAAGLAVATGVLV
jgi:hypothetical protein